MEKIGVGIENSSKECALLLFGERFLFFFRLCCGFIGVQFWVVASACLTHIRYLLLIPVLYHLAEPCHQVATPKIIASPANLKQDHEYDFKSK